MTLPTITYDDLVKMEPCWLEDTEENAEKQKLLKTYAARKDHWNALDILELPDNECNADEKMWAVLREELIPAPILHEFACRCAERTLSRVDNPDPRSVAAIDAKRKWLRGEIDDEALLAAWYAAWDAALHAERHAAWSAARDAERRWQVEELVRMLTEEDAPC